MLLLSLSKKVFRFDTSQMMIGNPLAAADQVIPFIDDRKGE